jgi:choline kinase
MTNTIALVLAAGEAERMNGNLKQLLPIGDTTVLGRMLSQMKRNDIRTIVVTHKSAISEHHHRVHSPKNHNTICDTLLSTSHLWDDRTIVLLGDVVYSKNTMSNIVGCSDDIRVFGNTWEIFSVVFKKKNHGKVKAALRKGRTHRLGKLRYFYHAYCGFEMGCQEVEAEPLEDDVFFYVKDWTRDIDTPYKYDRLMIEIVNKGIIRGEPR